MSENHLEKKKKEKSSKDVCTHTLLGLKYIIEVY